MKNKYTQVTDTRTTPLESTPKKPSTLSLLIKNLKILWKQFWWKYANRSWRNCKYKRKTMYKKCGKL